MKNLSSPEIWFITGSQHLYGEVALKQVAANGATEVGQRVGARNPSPTAKTA